LICLVAAAPLFLHAGLYDRMRNISRKVNVLIIFIIILIYYILIINYYIVCSFYFDPYEVEIAVVSSLLSCGNSLYHGLDSAERATQMADGPILYSVNGWFLDLFGPSVFASKVGVALAGITGCVLVYTGLRRSAGPRGAAAGAGFLILTLLLFYNISFW